MKVCTTCGAEWPDDTKFCPSDGSPLRAADGQDSIVGGVLQSYHIIKKLGEGGMGAVYLGEHVKMGRKSAIKVMTQSLAQDPDAIARFNREAANAASINHLNVCAIYDFGETTDGTIFLAMEFIEGEALTDLIKREGPLDLKRASTILRQTGDALQAAHELGIVHRDLKPDNIMIAKARDGSDLVKVVDFGIAKAMGGEEGQNVTRTGLVVGTPEYMSPEQLSGDKLDGRSDVYSLALVFFRMITGVLPFEADSAQEIMIKRLTDDPTRLNDALPGGNFPERLQQVLDKAMERMPSDRYASADEFARKAAEAIAQAPISISPPVDTQEATQLLGTSAEDAGATEQLKKTRLSQPKATIAMSELDAVDDERTKQALRPRGTGAAEEKHETTPDERPRRDESKPSKRKPVVAITASVVAVAGIAGGIAAVAFTNGSEQSEPAQDSAQVALATEDSGASSNVRESGDQGQVSNAADIDLPQDPIEEIESDPADITQPTSIDLTTIAEELVRLGRRILPDSSERVRDSARSRLLEIFDMQEVPDSMRARAASVLAEYYEEQSRQDACTWINRAIRLHPDNDPYRSYKDMILECPT